MLYGSEKPIPPYTGTLYLHEKDPYVVYESFKQMINEKYLEKVLHKQIEREVISALTKLDITELPKTIEIDL